MMTNSLFLGFSKGWKENFMSGDQEPWVFRGGLVADLQVNKIILYYSRICILVVF